MDTDNFGRLRDIELLDGGELVEKMRSRACNQAAADRRRTAARPSRGRLTVMSGRVLTAAIVLAFFAVGAGVCLAAGLPWCLGLLLVFLALAINGIAATVEEDSPGGFNNPDAANTPSYILRLHFIGRRLTVVVVSIAVLLLALALLVGVE